MRGEPAQPRSEPVNEVTEPAPPTATSAGHDYMMRRAALDVAMRVERSVSSVEQLLKDAKAIELYLKGGE